MQHNDFINGLRTLGNYIEQKSLIHEDGCACNITQSNNCLLPATAKI